MKIRITGLAELNVAFVSAVLDEAGFKCDVDYTTLYGVGWVITGLEINNLAAATLVMDHLAGRNTRPAPPTRREWKGEGG